MALGLNSPLVLIKHACLTALSVFQTPKGMPCGVYSPIKDAHFPKNVEIVSLQILSGTVLPWLLPFIPVGVPGPPPNIQRGKQESLLFSLLPSELRACSPNLGTCGGGYDRALILYSLRP